MEKGGAIRPFLLAMVFCVLLGALSFEGQDQTAAHQAPKCTTDAKKTGPRSGQQKGDEGCFSVGIIV